MKYFLSLLAFFPAILCAAEIWGSTTLGSVHSNREQDLREQNFGFGLEYHEKRELMYMAGSYMNSHDKRSLYAFTAWTPIDYGIVRFGLMAGFVNGYPKLNNGNITPALVGLARIEMNKLGVNLTLIPPRLKESPYTLGVQVKFGF
ncbi:hypothetical protein [Janthinobacterium sp. 17J80-10]|uniref:hypothetical protein n=1 Tax=Janthinobacterium sp. 17J80-10 TaxID=2497863 RepID=UPI00100559B8|nr:hypothetical protein [Janthinobacterium sp. 17J80-10]QAU35277.1 hypothetical protein EKL02_14445 [Janthinobacterium sp. 17J80-10]